MMEYDPEDISSFPPALRRKLFSNLERFRLEQLRLAQTTQSDSQGYRPRLTGRPASSPHSPSTRRAAQRPVSPRRLKTRKRLARRQRKPKVTEGYLLAAQAESLWFHSLPPKIQQQQFSREERARFAAWRASFICDAADKALYKLARPSLDSSISSVPSATRSLSSLDSSMASSKRHVDSAVDMDESFYDSFRWLEEDDDIDLTLSDYNSPTPKGTNSVPATPITSNLHRRKPSFRRTMSFTSMHRGRTSSSSIPRGLSQLSNVPSTLNSAPSTGKQLSFTRPKSSAPVVRHASQGSVTSIDHPAQYYQDPEARLKLRVYLASPQKFDEAIEFGFPSLDNKDNTYQARSSIEPRRQTQESARTFLEDDSTPALPDFSSGHIITEDSGETAGAPSPQPCSPSSADDRQNWRMSKRSTVDRGPLKPIPVGYAQNGGLNNREMTLKMTLTRADLRSTSESPGPQSPGVSIPDDPLRLAELPPLDEKHPIWDSPEENQGMMKRMWRKLRKRRA